MITNISAVIITFNEEANIKRCIDSVTPVAEEVIVVDSNSSDNTVQIAEDLGAKVISQDFLGHIEQKNFAAKLASGELILSLDADEALTQETINEIQKIKEDPKFDGYFFNRLNNYCGTWINHSGWYPDQKLRLWKKNSGEWGGKNPHDTFLLYEGKSVKEIDTDILHYTFKTVAEHKKQIEFFTDIGAAALFKNNKKHSFLKPYLSAVTKFISAYFIRLGFLDGHAGFKIAFYSAGAKIKKYKKLSALHSQKQTLTHESPSS